MARKLDHSHSWDLDSDEHEALADLWPGAEETDFVNLMKKLTPRDRRVVAVVVGRVAETEALLGQEAALDLIDDIEAVIRGPGLVRMV